MGDHGILAYTYPEHIGDFLAAGINVFRFSLPLGWSAPGKFDYADGDATIEAFCGAGPEVKVFPMIWIDGPETKWWELEYPDEVALMRGRTSGELCREAPGVREYARPGVNYTPTGDAFDRLHQGVPCMHSFASEIWRDQAAEAVRRAVAHYSAKFPGRLAGLYLCAGLSHEWFNWGNYTDDALFDYSPPMRRYFQRWLSARYASPDDLGKAWGRPVASWHDVEPPMPSERTSADSGALPDPAKNAAADFAAALSDAQADCFLLLCREARAAAPERGASSKVADEAVSGSAGVPPASSESGQDARAPGNVQRSEMHPPERILVGGFFGYWWNQTDFPCPARNGQLALQRVLDSPEVDFLASPLDYSLRGVGGVTGSQAVTGSVSHHGKRFINSADVKLSHDKHGWWQSFVRVPENDAEAVELLKRDFGFSMAEGCWHSWVDLFGGAFSRPDVKSALLKLQQIAAKNPDLRRPPIADALVVIDETSLRLVTPSSGLWTLLFPVQKQWNLHRSGFPWTMITLEDYLRMDWPDARLVNFVNVFQADDARVGAIHAKLRASGATAIWHLFPGFIGPTGFDLARAGALTGFHLERIGDSTGDWNFSATSAGLAAGVPEEYGSAALRDLCGSRMRHYPSPDQLAGSPRLAIRPRQGDEPLARWADDPAIALAETCRPGFPSFFNAGPLLPETVLHSIAKRSRVHCHAPAGNVVYANRRFLCIQTGGAPDITIHLPEGKFASNLWDESGPPAPGDFQLHARPESVHLWRLDDTASLWVR